MLQGDVQHGTLNTGGGGDTVTIGNRSSLPADTLGVTFDLGGDFLRLTNGEPCADVSVP